MFGGRLSEQTFDCEAPENTLVLESSTKKDQKHVVIGPTPKSRYGVLWLFFEAVCYKHRQQPFSPPLPIMWSPKMKHQQPFSPPLPIMWSPKMITTFKRKSSKTMSCFWTDHHQITNCIWCFFVISESQKAFEAAGFGGSDDAGPAASATNATKPEDDTTNYTVRPP